MPADRLGFVKNVLETLGGRPFEHEALVLSQMDRHALAEEQSKRFNLEWLAQRSLRFVQLEEALGRTPQMKEFGISGFQDRCAVLSPDPQQAWNIYAAIVEVTRKSAVGTP